MFKICGEPDSTHEGVCLRHMVSWNRQRRGMFSMYDEPESPNEGGMFKIFNAPGSTASGAA